MKCKNCKKNKSLYGLHNLCAACYVKTFKVKPIPKPRHWK